LGVGANDEGQADEVPQVITHLLRSKHLCRLKSLDLANHALTHEVLAALLSTPSLLSVDELQVLIPTIQMPDLPSIQWQLESRFNRVTCYA
jgi:hypothetical protein